MMISVMKTANIIIIKTLRGVVEFFKIKKMYLDTPYSYMYFYMYNNMYKTHVYTTRECFLSSPLFAFLPLCPVFQSMKKKAQKSL